MKRCMPNCARHSLAGKVIGGHYPSPDLGVPFHAYAAGGIEDDHEGTRIEDAVARARQGMKVMLRHGSAWHDVAAQVAAITSKGLEFAPLPPLHRRQPCRDHLHRPHGPGRARGDRGGCASGDCHPDGDHQLSGAFRCVARDGQYRSRTFGGYPAGG